MLSKLSLAASEARKATMESIADFLDNAAAKNGGHVPRGFIPKVIQQFSKVTPGLTRDQINHYYKKEYKKEHKSGPELSLASLPQNDERGTTNGSALVVAPSFQTSQWTTSALIQKSSCKHLRGGVRRG
jgi:hypothetical protein